MASNPTPSDPETDVLVRTTELAVRWKCSPDTARNRTRSPGFPVPYVFGPRSSRWVLAEVDDWEQSKRAPRAAHVTTGSRPQHKAGELRPPARIRTTIRPAA